MIFYCLLYSSKLEISKNLKNLDFKEALKYATSNEETLLLAIHESQANSSYVKTFNNIDCFDASDGNELEITMKANNIKDYKTKLIQNSAKTLKIQGSIHS